MNWLKKKIIGWVREDRNESNRFQGRASISVVEDTTEIMDDPIRFELQGVVGGHLLRVKHPYDHKQDRQPSTTYIIQSGEDIGSRISKIVNMELMK
jgi:hypothetical protein